MSTYCAGCGGQLQAADGPPAERSAYGGFWRRVLAVVIDTVVLMIPLSIARMMISPESLQNPEFTDADAAWMLVNTVVGWLYWAGMHSSQLRATLGKLALGLRVVDYHGERISFLRATGRHFAEFLSAILLGIGYLMVVFTRRRQGLHDMMAGTLVVRQEYID